MKRFLLLGCTLLFGGSLASLAADQSLAVDAARSRIEVDVKATMGSFVGHLDNYEAAITVDDGTMAVKTASLAFRFTDVKTGEDKRDRHMNDWQQTETYPDCRFELTGLTGRSGASFIAVGRFTLHGQTRTLQFPVQISTEDRTMIIDGEAVIDTGEFGLPVIRKFVALKVNPAVTVRFHLQGRVGTAPAGTA